MKNNFLYKNYIVHRVIVDSEKGEEPKCYPLSLNSPGEMPSSVSMKRSEELCSIISSISPGCFAAIVQALAERHIMRLGSVLWTALQSSWVSSNR